MRCQFSHVIQTQFISSGCTFVQWFSISLNNGLNQGLNPKRFQAAIENEAPSMTNDSELYAEFWMGGVLWKTTLEQDTIHKQNMFKWLLCVPGNEARDTGVECGSPQGSVFSKSQSSYGFRKGPHTLTNGTKEQWDEVVPAPCRLGLMGKLSSRYHQCKWNMWFDPERKKEAVSAANPFRTETPSLM